MWLLLTEIITQLTYKTLQKPKQKKILLVPTGVLAYGSAHARPPIDTSDIFSAYVSDWGRVNECFLV
jgi:hypothetical protein